MSAGNPGLVNAIRGPVIMITIGVLFLLDKFTGMQFGATWPVLLIVAGVMTLAGSNRSGAAPRVPPYPGDYAGVPPQTPPAPPPYTPPGARR